MNVASPWLRIGQNTQGLHFKHESELLESDWPGIEPNIFGVLAKFPIRHPHPSRLICNSSCYKDSFQQSHIDKNRARITKGNNSKTGYNSIHFIVSYTGSKVIPLWKCITWNYLYMSCFICLKSYIVIDDLLENNNSDH